MIKIFVGIIILSFALASPSWAEWKWVTDIGDRDWTLGTPGGPVYIEDSLVKKHDGYLYVTTLNDYPKTQTTGNSSSKMYFQIECADQPDRQLEKYKPLGVELYSGPMGSGTKGGIGLMDSSITDPMDWVYIYELPGTAVAKIITHVCKGYADRQTESAEAIEIYQLDADGTMAEELAEILELVESIDTVDGPSELAAAMVARLGIYCKTKSGSVYHNLNGGCGALNKEITKDEYDRLKGKKTATALPPCPPGDDEYWHNCFGTYTPADGNKYVGEWRDDKFHGQGTFTTANGNKYVGEWRDDKKHGQGTFTWSDGNKYVGEWRDDLINGQGTTTFADGSKYVGEYRDGKYHGHGTATFADGDKYVGELRDGNFHGQGTYIFSNGNKYVGGYRDGKHHGQGTATFASGDKYVGEWRDDKQRGQGTYSWYDGSKYVGEWRDDKRHGEGTFTRADGGGLDGVWENDKFKHARRDPEAEKREAKKRQADRDAKRAEAELEVERRKQEQEAYCKRDDGSVVAVDRLNLDDPCGPHTEISNAEYDRLKGKKTDTASKSTGSSGKTVYCKTKNDFAYRSHTGRCGGNKIITKAEYDRLKGKKTTTASKSSTASDKTAYCRKNDGTVYKRGGEIGCNSIHAKITKDEYDRLKGKKTTTASKSTESSSSAQTNDVSSILDWLRSIGLEKFEEEFLSNDITPDILPELTNADLKEMGINSLGARKRILKAIKEAP